MVHDVPSQVSISVWALRVGSVPTKDPTATHAVAEVQDTPEKALSMVPACGTVCSSQLLPFHRAASANSVPVLSTKLPTAVQALGAVHDTSSNSPVTKSAGVGTFW